MRSLARPRVARPCVVPPRRTLPCRRPATPPRTLAPRAAPTAPAPTKPPPLASPYGDTLPAPFASSLTALDWGRLCGAVRAFASTTAGANAAQALPLGSSIAESASLAAATDAAAFVEGDLGRRLEFGGMATASGARAAARAERGATLSGRDLAAALSLATGAVRLATDVRAASRAAGPAGGRVKPLVAAVASIDADTLKPVIKTLTPCLDPGGGLTDAASDALRSARSRLRDATSRARKACGGGGGEPAEKWGRVCIAVGPSDAPPRGAMLLGIDPASGQRFYEPAGAVAANNALAAARGEAEAADQAARAVLSSVVADASFALAAALDAVVDVDLAVARARYGVWIDGALARLVPLDKAAARGGRARGGGGGATTAPPPPLSPTSPFIEAYSADAPLVELRSLRQPLLLAAHLSGRDAAARAAAARVRRAATPPAPIPPPPVPIDFVVRRGARCVVVTGPNTGGKTASLKSLALAALAARAGLPLPARSERGGPPRVPWFDAVLADVGDAQALGAGLSTFSGHLARVSALRGVATPASLILLDELGAGTDPEEGAALGAALLRTLAGVAGEGGGARRVDCCHHARCLPCPPRCHRRRL